MKDLENAMSFETVKVLFKRLYEQQCYTTIFSFPDNYIKVIYKIRFKTA